jgi:hypothetical protein
MAAWRRAIELSLGDEDTAKLRSIAQLWFTATASMRAAGRQVEPVGAKLPIATAIVGGARFAAQRTVTPSQPAPSCKSNDLDVSVVSRQSR